MRLDPLLQRAEKLVPVLEAIGVDKVRIDSISLDNPLVELTNQTIEAVAFYEWLHVCRAPRSAEFLNIDPWDFPKAGYREVDFMRPP
jgi:hypothetical protein